MTTIESKRSIAGDVVAGLTTSAVVIPKAMAYAGIAGLSVETGMYAALIPMIVYAFLGSSTKLSVSTTTTLAILTGAQLALAVPDGDPAKLLSAVATLGLLVGVFLLAAGFLKLGFVANLISDPVLTGFKAGIAMVIIVDQFPKLLGVHITKTGFFRDMLSIGNHVPETSMPTLILSVVMVVLLIGIEHYFPRIPAPLLAVAIGITAAAFLDLKASGVALTGHITAGLPIPKMPDLNLLLALWPGALGIALMSFTESMAAARAFVKEGDPPVKANRELIALGGANLAGAFFSSVPSGGGTSQTAVNAKAGARTKVAGGVTALVTLATLLFLAPLVSLLPQAALAAVVIVTTAPLFSPKEFAAIRKIRRREFRWALVSCAGVVVLGTLPGILVAVGVTLLTLFYEGVRPNVSALGRKPGTDFFRPLLGDHPGDEQIPGLLILRIEGRWTFANAPQVRDRLRALVLAAKPQVVILDCRVMIDLEYTALRELTEAEKALREKGIPLWLVALNPEVLKVVENSPLGETLGHGRMFFKLRDAVAAYESKREPGIGKEAADEEEDQETD